MIAFFQLDDFQISIATLFSIKDTLNLFDKDKIKIFYQK